MSRNKMMVKSINIFLCVLSALSVAGCTGFERQEADSFAHKDLTFFLSGSASFDLEWEKNTKTAILWNPAGTQHRVNWSVGDKIYVYSEAGVRDVLTVENLSDGGHGTQFKVPYRMGDEWFVAFCHGSLLEGSDGHFNGDNLTIRYGVPHIQNGVFKDLHLCLEKSPVEADNLVLKNLQSFIRFTVDGKELDSLSRPMGTVNGKKTKRIVVSNLTSEIMSGDMNIDINRLAYSLTQRTEADSTIEIRPDSTGYFEPATDYYVAVPVRPYKRGIRFDFFDDNDRKLGFVNTSGVTFSYSKVVNVDDILEYMVIFGQRLQLTYCDELIADSGDTSDPSTAVGDKTITIVKGHTAEVKAVIAPESATNRSLAWESSDPLTASVDNDGNVTGTGVGKVIVSASAMDGSGLQVSFSVEVKDNTGLGHTDYTDGGSLW